MGSSGGSGRSNPAGDVLQFTAGACLFAGGIVLFLNQVMVHSAWMGGPWRPWQHHHGWSAPLLAGGTPGMGLLMIPLGLGVCLLFAGSHPRWARLLVWGSLAAIAVVVLNSIRFTLLPATLWQLTVTVVMIASGGGLMFRSLSSYAEPGAAAAAAAVAAAVAAEPAPPGGSGADGETQQLRRELEELRRRLDARGDG